MLRVLIASQPARAGWLGGTTFSTVTHGALIALAVVSSVPPVTSVREQRAAEVERVTYVEPARLLELKKKKAEDSAPPASKSTLNFSAASELASIQDLVSKPIEIPDITAATDLTLVSDAWRANPDGLGVPIAELTKLVLAKSTVIAPENGVYTADMVERSTEPKRGNPKPRYPAELIAKGIEGEFMVRFVVDSTGKVAEDKMEFPGTMNRLFISAVKTALLKSRYIPAMIAGRVVPQEVVQEFRFAIKNR